MQSMPRDSAADTPAEPTPADASGALHDCRQRLDAVLEDTGVALWDWNVQTGALEVSPQFAALLGHEPADLQPLTVRTWTERVHPDDLLGTKDQLRRHFEGEQARFDIECRLRHREGHWVWVHTRGRLVSRTATGQPLRMLGTQQDIGERKELLHQLFDAAHTDRLTGLPNRAMLLQRLELAVAFLQVDPGERFALFFLDFDRFKNINDTLGHAAGDQLLMQIAARLRGALRVGDVHGGGGNAVARFGGDEFVVLLGDARTESHAKCVADQLLDLFARPYELLGQEVHSSVSIGIAMGEASGRSADDLLRDADIAMYEAKRTGRGRAVFFDRVMHDKLRREQAMEAALRGAIERDEFSLVYQPIVDLESGAVTAVEALLRWHHPELGEVQPNDFVPVAEDCALIVPIGEWVLREACTHWMRWWRTLGERVPPVLSVNVSRVQLQQPDRLVATLRRLLDETGMPAHRLQLEVTEREIARDPAPVRQLLDRLHDTGVRLAMDDFGTGGSNLAALRKYPFDTIKIDKSLLDGLADHPDALTVVHATVNLIQNLGMASVAEGVEDAAQIGILQAIGCRFAQGFLFALPVPAQQVPLLPNLHSPPPLAA